MRPLDPGDPREVGRYRILAALGEGGMGRVLLAVGPDGRFAAVKHIFPTLAHDPVFRARFRHEVSASRLVSGAYTAPVLDADTESDTPWLASLYIPGPSLSDVLDVAGPLDVAGVHYLAGAGLIHRDLKPGNVLLAHDGPRVIDFGIARAVEGSDLTATNALVGSPAFMSPEQALGGDLTPASDVFSLGSLLFTAATGRRPFAGTSTPQTLYNVAHTTVDLSPLPPTVREVVEPCLAKDPALRPTPRQIVEHLGPVPPPPAPWPTAVGDLITAQERRLHAAAAVPPPPSPPPPPPSPPTPTEVPGGDRNLRVIGLTVGTSAVLTVVLVAVLLVVLGGEDTDSTAQEGNDEATGTASPTVSTEEALTTDRLRLVDPCAVLADTRVPSLGLLTPEENPTFFHRCHYQSSGSGGITLTIGEPLHDQGARNAGTTDGRTVLLTHVTGGCEASVQLSDDPRLAVSASDPGAPSCKGPRAALDAALERLRGDGILRDLPADSALDIDPCLLLTEEVTRDLLGPTTTTASGLHDCAWEGDGEVRVRIVPGFPGQPPEEGSEPVEFDGIVGHAVSDSEEYCSITWPHRRVDDVRSEDVNVFYYHSGVDDPCVSAQQLAGAVAANLPHR